MGSRVGGSRAERIGVRSGVQPFEASGTPVPPVPPSLSPSRVADFMTCPLRHRLRAIDRPPERPSAAARGTLVHAAARPERHRAAAEIPPRPAAHGGQWWWAAMWRG
ncbi:PD-(D/E)XK nuclease family protein [Streptomyces viridosporus]|uniref:PD-(D/E)XK nuclease family protein n=1 Tax=Streptomyces viridosporus TaxID=67581 RepID=UPI0036FF5C25